MSNEMTDSSRSNLFIAYFVIRDRGEEGFDSGYLCIDQDGAPVEYWYTKPVKPSRIQELLYGTSLRPILFGQCIVGQLLQSIDQHPTVIVTDHEEVLTGYKGSTIPIVHVTAESGGPVNGRSRRLDTPRGALKLTWRTEDASALEPLLEHLANADVQEGLHRTKSVLEELSHLEKPISGGIP